MVISSVTDVWFGHVIFRFLFSHGNSVGMGMHEHGVVREKGRERG